METANLFLRQAQRSVFGFPLPALAGIPTRYEDFFEQRQARSKRLPFLVRSHEMIAVYQQA